MEVEFDQLAHLFNSGHYAELERRAASLLQRHPASGLAWKLLCASLQMQGKDALHALQNAAKFLPNDTQAHNNLGSALQDLGQLEGAVTSYRRAIKINPNDADVCNNLGTALQDLRRLDEAVASYRRALALNPDYAEAYNNLGIALQDLGQLDSALASYRRALKIKPDYAEAHCGLGLALKNIGKLDDAVDSYQRALEIKPDYAEAYNNLGNALKDLWQLDEAVVSYRQALTVKPDYAEAHNNLGSALQDLGQFVGAMASHQQALEIKPDYVEAHCGLGNVLLELGQLDGAVASYRQALAIKPDFIIAHSNLLFVLNFTVAHTTPCCLDAAREYGRVVSKRAVEHFSTWRCETKPEYLRVGLVSGDLRNHPVGYALESLLAQLDPTRIELIAYPTSNKADELTALIQPRFLAWKPIFGMSDRAAADMIHSDGVHVLLDLSGHTANSRLPIFTWKPAPVQASWLGYFATTGVPEMDYLLTSEVAVPEVHKEHFTESVWYLPDIWLCFTPPEFDLPVVPLPALENGYLTFGCFQRLDKMGEGVLQAWGKLLSAIPKSRLLLANKQLGDTGVAARFSQRLQQSGIDSERVTIRGTKDSRAEYLARYNEVDAMLDTFPYPGVTTTCEALWMGVPTLTLGGDTLLSRQGAGVVTPAGLEDWVASSETDYVEKAISLTSDLSKLANLRTGLRAQVLASPVYDAPRFARNFEAALWGMWQQWQVR